MGAKYTQAQNRATQKYIKAAYDSVMIRVPKGKREEYKEKAKELGYESFNGFAVAAFDEKIEREVESHE